MSKGKDKPQPDGDAGRNRKEKARGRRGREEGMVESNQNGPRLRLKVGGEPVDVRYALRLLDDFRTMQQESPEMFETLVALAQNRPETTTPERVEALKKHSPYWFDRDGHLGDEGLILASALERRDNTYVLVQPFRLESEDEKRIAEQALQQNEQALRSLLFGKGRRPGGSFRE